MPSYKLVGAEQLLADLENLGKVSTKNLRAIVHQAINPVLADAKVNAPVGETGMLKKGITLVNEKSKTKGKVVIDLKFNKSMNDIFVKNSKAGKRSYYPSSQEFGYTTKSGKYVPGYNFLKNALAKYRDQARETIEKPILEAFERLNR